MIEIMILGLRPNDTAYVKKSIYFEVKVQNRLEIQQGTVILTKKL